MTALNPGSRLGVYEILGPLGAGGMGEVFRARDTKLDRDVAIKVLPEAFLADPDRVARFQREAKTLAALNHPNVAHLYGLEDAKTGDGRAFLVMELVEGDDLSRRIAEGPLPLDEALPIARQIVDTLAAAHEQGIVHRDLKPANIKVRSDGTVKVLDFGLAKALVSEGSGPMSGSLSMSPTLTTPAMTAMGMILGTASYMAPEQAKGRTVDKRADIWAFGCVLYEMLTGRRPFEGDDVADVMATVLKSEPDWKAIPATVPESIRLLIQRCLEKDPRKRVGDIAVARFLLTESLPAPAVVTAAPAARKRWPAAAAALGLAVVSAIAAVAITLRTTAQTPVPMRFALATSAAAPFSPVGSDRDIAVSPDGTKIVYRANIGGSFRLAVRDVRDIDARVLDGADQPRSPVVSPDGQWVAFLSFGALKKIPIGGGQPVTLSAFSGTGRGLTWHGDTIVAATGDASGGLLAVPAAGGAATVLTMPNAGAAESDHWWPSFLPDGDRILYVVIGTNSYDIALFDRKTKTSRTIVRGGSAPQYVAPGLLVFAGPDTLRAVRFDLRRGEVIGEPVPVLESVSTMVSGAANYAVSPNGLLVYVPAGDVESEVRRSLVWVSPDGREQPVATEPRPFNDPKISSDGRYAVVELNDESDDVWIADVSRGALTRQSFEAGEDETPIWTPDGASIVWSTTRASVPRAVYRRRADGSGPEETLWSGPSHIHVDAVTPDGTQVIVTASGVAGAQTDIMVLPLQGDRKMTPLMTTRFAEKGAALSPDGRFIAYCSDESGRDEVYVHAFPSMEGKTQASTAGGCQPVWSKRGHELYFRGADDVMVVRVQTTPRLTVDSARKLFADRYYSKGPTHTGYDVASDGRFLFVKEANANTRTQGTPPSLVVVVNWFEDLKTRLK